MAMTNAGANGLLSGVTDRNSGRTVLAAIALTICASSAWAGTTVVNSLSSLRTAITNAQAGDRILMAPGTYTGTLYVNRNGSGGTADNPIIIAAQDPFNPPVFQSTGDTSSASFQIQFMPHFVLDGMIMNNPVNYNAIQIDHCDHFVLKNIQSRTQNLNSPGQSAFKMAGDSDYLFFNNSATQWSLCGLDQVGCKNGLLMNNNFSSSYASSDCGFQAKGGSYNIGIYRNTFTNAGTQAINMGQQSSASSFPLGNIGWEGYDQVAMGNKFFGGGYPVNFSTATNCRFEYNTVVNPDTSRGTNGLLRILNQGLPGVAHNWTSNCFYSHNLVQYGNVIQTSNIGSDTSPQTFTYDSNYWYKTTNPSNSVPKLWDDPANTILHTQVNPINGPNPQLDASGNPQYGPAKAYGASSPDVAAAFQAYTGRFQWAWDLACSYLPASHPAIAYSPTGITFDASASTLGVNSYGSNTLTGYGWDLNGDGVADLSGTANQFFQSYDDLQNIYGLSDGLHTASLLVTVTNELGQTVQSDASAAVFNVPEPSAVALLVPAAVGLLLTRRGGSIAVGSSS